MTTTNGENTYIVPKITSNNFESICSTSAPVVRLDLVPPSAVDLPVVKNNFKNNNNNNVVVVKNNSNTLAPPILCSPSKKSSKVSSSTKNARLSSRSIQLGNLVRTKLYSSFPNLHNQILRKEFVNSKWYCQEEDENINKVLKAVASDHIVSTPSEDNKIRRTVFIERTDEEKFGFIIQSYAFRRCNKTRMEQITYVDYVALDGPAFRAGLRAGDVIFAINGKNIQNYTHKQLIQYIADCKSLRMVVLFENCVNRIELCARAIKLKKLLSDKEFELKTLSLQEDRLLKGQPLWTEEEILMLIRTPCGSPTIERIWNCADVNSIASDVSSFVGVASSTSSEEHGGDDQIDYADKELSSLTNEYLIQESDNVKFLIGDHSGSSSASNRSSIYSRHSSLPAVVSSVKDEQAVDSSTITLNEDSSQTKPSSVMVQGNSSMEENPLTHDCPVRVDGAIVRL